MADFKTAYWKSYSLGVPGDIVPRTMWNHADFNQAQELVKKAEGGYQADARDDGNYTGGKIGVGTLIGTNWGISAPALKAYLKKEPTVADMKNLSYATAVKIYKSEYWNPVKGDAINNQKLANIIYDAAVNHGPGKAIALVKESLGTNTYDTTKINAADPQVLFDKIGKKREKFYLQKGGYALNSWISRLRGLGYSGLEAARENIKTTIAVVLTLSAIITGVIIIKNNK